MCDLAQLSNNVWIFALGTLQAVVISKDLKLWHPLYVEGFEKEFNSCMNVEVCGSLIAISTGENLLLLDREEAERKLREKLVITPYHAFTDRIRSVLFTVRRRIRAWLSVE